MVRRAEYHIDTDELTVLAKNLITDKEDVERFNHVIVATGIFNTPNIPSFPGIDTFPGRIQPSHDFRDAKEYKESTKTKEYLSLVQATPLKIEPCKH